MSGRTGTVILYSPAEQRWLEFSRPVEIVGAEREDDVIPSLRLVEDSVRRRGLYAAGFISYEAAPGIDPVLRVRAGRQVPLTWFGLYERAETFQMPPDPGPPMASLDWQATVSWDDYARALEAIRGRIAAGLTYQVNYTYRLRAPFRGDPWSYFRRLAGGSASGYAAYIDTGRWAVCSASPELFFQLQDDAFESRPMKGTAPRGGTAREDEEAVRRLEESEKDRAENLMIVDMIRNDIGRVADVGTVAVPRLCGVERFPTVLQMTSTVTARVRASFSDVMSALFPCASITGAPKVSTMGIIAELETTPRGLYCGSIGCLVPGGDRPRAQFNVAIRTVTIDRATGVAEYGVGGGILWDSDPVEEYRECEVKTRVLRHGTPVFELLEAILWTPSDGYYLLDRHMSRLGESARYFGIPLDPASVHEALDALPSRLAAEDHKVRVAVSRAGEVTVTAQPLAAIAKPAVQRVCLAGRPVSSADVHRYHKTSERGALDREIAEHAACDDVILWNENGEITESCTANVVADAGGVKITPPVSCGLLAGTFRAQILDEGAVKEGTLTPADIRGARALWLVNSVRKWMPVELVDD